MRLFQEERHAQHLSLAVAGRAGYSTWKDLESKESVAPSSLIDSTLLDLSLGRSPSVRSASADIRSEEDTWSSAAP